MVALANTGTFIYNGVSWISLYRTKIDVKPVKDSAGRALVAREYTLDVEGHLGCAPGSTTDASLTLMRRLLEQPGGSLQFSAKGFGTLNVNVAGGQLWDAAYGPWPEILAWDPVGNDQGCLVRWRCTTLVPCEENPIQKGILELCWEEVWDIDEDGYTTRTIEGHLVCEATRATVGSRAIPDNADAYRNQVVPDLPLGFRRTQSFTLSEDKRTLTFRFVDSQLPMPLPNGVTHAEVRHKIRWSLPSKNTSNIMSSTISGTITLPAGTPKAAVFPVIMLILRSRWALGGRTMGFVAGNVSFVYLLQQIEYDDDMFGRGTSFTAQALLLPKSGRSDVAKYLITPQTLLTVSGMWAPITGTDFVQWKGSVFQQAGAGLPYAPRGMAGMGFLNSDDVIVDLCARQTQSLKTNSVTSQIFKKVTRSSPLPEPPGPIDPDATWLRYRSSVVWPEDDRVARHKPLSGTLSLVPATVQQGFVSQVQQRQLTTGGVGGASLLNNPPSVSSQNAPGPDSTQPQGPGVTSNSGDLLQQVGSPTYTVILEGDAVRLGYAIPTPRIQSVGGVQVKQLWQVVSQEQIGAISGLPIYAATWRVAYAVPSCTQQALPMPANPAFD